MKTETLSNPTLPRYARQTTVRAMKIKHVRNCPVPGGMNLVMEDERFGPYMVSQLYMVRWLPEKGGYFIIDNNGVMSYSDADSFERNYKPVESQPFAVLDGRE